MKVNSVKKVTQAIKTSGKYRLMLNNNKVAQQSKTQVANKISDKTFQLRASLECQAEMMSPEEYINARNYIASLERFL